MTTCGLLQQTTARAEGLLVFDIGRETGIIATSVTDAVAVAAEELGYGADDVVDVIELVPADKIITITCDECEPSHKVTATAAEWARRQGRGVLWCPA